MILGSALNIATLERQAAFQAKMISEAQVVLARCNWVGLDGAGFKWSQMLPLATHDNPSRLPVGARFSEALELMVRCVLGSVIAGVVLQD